jgi:hypothetical protein
LPRAARTDLDFDLDEYDDEPQKRGGFSRLIARKPASSIGVGVAAILTVAVAVNLLLMQDQRHAAPLFQMKLKAADMMPPEVAPLPAPRPVELAAPVAAPPAAAPAAPVRTAVSQPARAEPLDPIAREIARGDTTAKIEKSKPVEARRPDPIAGLLRNSGAAPAPTPQAAAPSPSAVMAAQRALLKLGFVVKPDGVIRDSTKQAVARFERDNHMPVHGELTPKLMRELARVSGVEAQ